MYAVFEDHRSILNNRVIKLNRRSKKYLKHKFKMKTKKVSLFVVSLIIVVATALGSVASAEAFKFRLGKYTIGSDGINKVQPEEKIKVQPELQNDAEKHEQKQERISTNEINSLIEKANLDKATRTMLKSFTDEYFCVMTEERIAYVYVSQDGLISLHESKPQKCYKLKTKEQFAMRAWNQVRDGNLLSMDEINKNVKIPFSLKTKLFIAGMLS